MHECSNRKTRAERMEKPANEQEKRCEYGLNRCKGMPFVTERTLGGSFAAIIKSWLAEQPAQLRACLPCVNLPSQACPRLQGMLISPTDNVGEEKKPHHPCIFLLFYSFSLCTVGLDDCQNHAYWEGGRSRRSGPLALVSSKILVQLQSLG